MKFAARAPFRISRSIATSLVDPLSLSRLASAISVAFANRARTQQSALLYVLFQTLGLIPGGGLPRSFG